MTKTCFIISSIGEGGTRVREQANEKYELIFEPILKELGYEVTRADKIGKPGSISNEIVSNVIYSDLVIADVSDRNPNVFYELAIRNAVKKPVIVFRKLNQVMPFDIYDTRAIDIVRDNPRIWDNAKKALRVQIKNAEGKPDMASESILSRFTFQLDAEHVQNSTNEISDILRDLQEDVRSIGRLLVTKPTTMSSSQQQVKESSTPYDYIVSMSPGSSAPGCEETGDCFDPSILKIKEDETVLWINEDTGTHTVTSGSPGDGPSGMFDSGLCMSGNSFAYTFDTVGKFSYYDMMHPWMKGIIVVK